jgi:membrane protein
MSGLSLLKSFLRACGSAAKRFWFHNRFNDCAAVAYYALLSLVPLVSLVIVIMSQFIGVSAAELGEILEQGGLLVPEFGEIFNNAVVEMVRYRASIGIVSLVITVWFASLVFGSIQTAFDRIFETFHPPLWALMKPRIAVLAAAVLLMLSFAFNTMMAVLRSLESPFFAPLIAYVGEMTWLAWVASLVLDVAIFMLILYTLPPKRLHDWRMVIPAALVGTVCWRIARRGFAVYLSYASSSLTFTGSAGAAVIFMLWIYYAALVLLFSGELLAALDRARRAHTDATS